MYEITAYWPDSRSEPMREHAPSLFSGLIRMVELRAELAYTTISLRTPDSMELVRMWGQPMADGKDWP